MHPTFNSLATFTTSGAIYAIICTLHHFSGITFVHACTFSHSTVVACVISFFLSESFFYVFEHQR